MKDRWLVEIELILERLSKHNPVFQGVEPKNTIHRINHNRKFHPEKPTYKDYISCVPAGKKNREGSRFYISVGLDESFIGGGLWRPQKENLEKMRGAIDYEGEKLKEILNDKKLKSFYDGLSEDDQKLKTSPQNYSKDHPYLDLLNHKNLIVTKSITQEDFCSDHFIDIIEEGYLAFQSFDEFILRALSV
jgi:uncharacterized protein (TIGR02453 family)